MASPFIYIDFFLVSAPSSVRSVRVACRAALARRSPGAGASSLWALSCVCMTGRASLSQAELASSRHVLVQALFGAPPPPPPGGATPSPGKSPGGGGGASSATLGARFKGDLNTLMTSLQVTAPHFVRCVKPNAEKVGRVFQGSMVMHQLRCAGLFEAIRIRKAGYAFRLPLARFVRHYSLVAPHAVAPALLVAGSGVPPPTNEALAEGARGLLAALREKLALPETQAELGAAVGAPAALSEQQVVIGKTKVFMRTAASKRALDEMQQRAAHRYVVRSQAFLRGALTRCRLFAERYKLKKMHEEAEAKARAASASLEAAELELMAIEDNASLTSSAGSRLATRFVRLWRAKNLVRRLRARKAALAREREEATRYLEQLGAQVGSNFSS